MPPSIFSRLPRFRVFAGMLFALLFLAACQTAPPRETGDFRAPDLAEINRLDPSVRLDIRYATANNFTGHTLYTQARAFLQRPAARALLQVQRALRPQGYGLVVFDAYRPWFVTQSLWDSASAADRLKGYVADPRTGSKHNRGCAVDLSLYDLRSGEEIAMPSGYDEFSERAHPAYAGGTEASQRARDLLRAAMEAEGFTVSTEEWWHFNYRDWPKYRLMNVRFEEIKP